MTVERKRQIVFGMVVALLIWPLLHHVLVLRYDLDKWSFLGFSMYITKRPILRITSVDMDWKRVDRADEAPYKAAGVRFLRERAAYGKLYDPDRLARDVFDVLERIDEFTWNFEILRMERSTAVFRAERIRYRCRRQPTEAGRLCEETRLEGAEDA